MTTHHVTVLLFDEAIGEGGDRMYELIGNRFAGVGDQTATTGGLPPVGVTNPVRELRKTHRGEWVGRATHKAPSAPERRRVGFGRKQGSGVG
jgi:hypothetical protein